MAEEKKSFVLYADLIHTVKKMPKEKAGELFLTILSYVNDENPIVDDLVIDLVFEPIKRQMKRDLVKWSDTKISKSENGVLGNLKRWNNDLYLRVIANELKIDDAISIAKGRKVSPSDVSDRTESQSVANVAVTVNDTVTVNVNAIVIDEEIPPAFGHLLQVKFFDINSGYPPRPSKDFPAILDIALLIHQMAGGKKKGTYEMDVGEQNVVMREWEKWCHWYRCYGNNKSLDYLVKFKLQDIAMEIKNGSARQPGVIIPVGPRQPTPSELKAQRILNNEN